MHEALLLAETVATIVGLFAVFMMLVTPRDDRMTAKVLLITFGASLAVLVACAIVLKLTTGSGG